MADTDTNVTTLRPKVKDVTAAERSRRYRRRKRRVTPAVTVPAPVTPKNAKQSEAVTPFGDPGRRAPTCAVDVTAYMAAIGLASVAALFSIRGMVQLFPGTPLLIIAMATMMESKQADRRRMAGQSLARHSLDLALHARCARRWSCRHQRNRCVRATGFRPCGRARGGYLGHRDAGRGPCRTDRCPGPHRRRP